MKRLIIVIFILSLFNFSFAQNDTLIIEKSTDKVIIGGQVYYVHIVKQGETLFSLSNAYNVSQKEIAKENPDIFLGLQIGQALKIPFIFDKGESSDDLNKQDFLYHRVKKGQTLYSLAKKYDVSQDDILACNPTVRYGINIDQIIKIPKSKEIVRVKQQILAIESLSDTIKIIDQFIYHTVEQKETVYSLTRFYEITEDILLEHNSFVTDGLKIGQVLKIPKIVDIESETVLLKMDDSISDSVLYEKRAMIAFSDSIDIPECEKFDYIQEEPFQIAVFLPVDLEKNDEEFYIDSSEVDDFGEKIYERIYYDPFYIYPRSLSFIEFYEGLLLAVDTLKQNGLSINMHVYDTQNDTARIKELLDYPELANMDLIIGPVFNHEIKLVSEFSRENGIKMVSPLSDNLKLVDENPYLFQVSPSYTAQMDEFAKYVANFKDKNIVLVHNGDSLRYSNIQLVRDKIFGYISIDTSINNIQFKEVVFKDSINVLEHALDDNVENIFIIPTNEEAFVTEVITNLNTLKSFGKEIKAIGLSRWQRFRNIDPEYFFNLNLSIATPFFIDYHKADMKNFILKYRDTYKTEPGQMAIHGYDVGMYFLSALKYYGKNFQNCIYNHNPDLLQADYRFVKWYETSGYENIGVVIIKYYDGYNIFRVDDFDEYQKTFIQNTREE